MNKSDYLADILSVSSATENQNLKMRSWYSLSNSSKWGLAIAVCFMPSFWGHEFRNQSDIVSLWWKAGFSRLNLLSTIYPNSQFCTKRHKRLFFQGFSGVFESFARKAKKENCKFEAWKCNFVFGLCKRKRGLSYILRTNLFRLLLFRSDVFFDYSDADIDVW